MFAVERTKAVWELPTVSKSCCRVRPLLSVGSRHIQWLKPLPNGIACFSYYGITEAKTKWKNIRDAFVKYRQKSKTKSGQRAKEVKPYKYAHLLEFIIPTLGERQTSGNLSDSEAERESTADVEAQEGNTQQPLSEDDSDDVSIIQPVKPAPSSKVADIPSTSTSLIPASTPRPPPKKRRCFKAQAADEVEVAIVDYLKAKKEPTPKRAEETDDYVTLFLNSMANSIRKLPAKAQAEVRFSIHKVVHDAEMEHLYSRPAEQLRPTQEYCYTQPSTSVYSQPYGMAAERLPYNPMPRSETPASLSSNTFESDASYSGTFTQLM
ncbi:uncharacterized protein LOC135494356 [Lineus longissimus]|uniref:uncharacterized protein LOC135489492 n=1 Tax=Lineus longissimus TaxID=88925 RepID=UPI00315DBF94